MRYRICDHVLVPIEAGENDIYRKFKFQFDNLLAADEIPTSDDAFSQLYVKDEEFERDIERFLKSFGNSMRFCVGYTGIGKTTSIRHCLNLGVSNVTRLDSQSPSDPNKKMIVFPSFFDGTRSMKQEDDPFNLTGRLSAVCTSLEEKHPELRDIIRTPVGICEFYKFLRKHTPRILELNDDFSLSTMSYEDEILARMKHAQKEYRFEYTANKLKYYIKCKQDLYDRLVIILDDVETLPERQQDNVVEQYLHLFECLRNTDFPKDFSFCINLLISIRPHTLRMYQRCEYNANFRRLEAYPVATNTVLKKQSVDLSLLFTKRFDYYTNLSNKNIGNKETWKACYDELMLLNRVFQGKYKDMILNLCFMNVREALAVYSQIFANRFWIQGNRLKETFFSVKSSEYYFNNINVIRAIGCNNSATFTGTENSVIPNFFLSTENCDYSIQCLLVMQYFVLYTQNLEGNKQITYGQNARKLGDIRNHWKSILAETREEALYRALVFLFEKKVLRKSIEDTDSYATLDTEASLDADSKLYISPRGKELMDMLGRDSVLLEMLRECAWREYEGREEYYTRQSSYELLIQGEQNLIFMDLLEYIDYLREKEESVFFDSTEKIDINAYRLAFGNSLVVSNLLAGVEKSLNYSGLISNPAVANKFARVRRHIDESRRKLQMTR